MPKERKLPRGGISQHVRQSELSNPFSRLLSSVPSNSTPALKARVTVLGPRARAREIQEADERIKQQLLSKCKE